MDEPKVSIWIRSGLFSHRGLRFLRRLAGVLAALFLLGALVYGLGVGVVRWKERSAEEAWAALDLPETRPTVRFRVLEANAGARAYDTLMEPIGLGIRSRLSIEEAGQETPWGGFLNDIHRFVERELESPAGSCAPFPSDLAEQIVPHTGTLDRAIALWLSEERPVWPSNPEGGRRKEAPHFLALRLFAEYLLADALQACAGGDAPRAERDIEAAWRVVEALLARPEVQAQEGAQGLASLCAGTARKIESLPSGWSSRLEVRPFQTGLEAALTLEGLSYLQAFRSVAAQPYSGRGARRERWLWKLYGRLWLRYSFADTGRRLAVELAFRRQRGLCEVDSRGVLNGDEAPWWTAMGGGGHPDHRAAWNRLALLRQSFEVSRMVLTLRQARGAAGGWPDALPETTQPECAGIQWHYGKLQTGGMRLELAPGLEVPGTAGKIELPLAFEAGP